MFNRNPLRKFGFKKTKMARWYIFNCLEIGSPEEMFRKAKHLNRKSHKEGQLKYFVWPVGGLYPQAQLVVGRKCNPYLPLNQR